MFKPPAFFKRLREKARKYRLHVWRLEGKERHSGADFTMIYAGHLLNRNYITHITYGGAHRETHLGKAWIWNVAGIAREHSDLAMILTETEGNYFERFSRDNDFYIPCWIDGEIEFSRFDEMMKRSENLRSDIRKIHKLGYEYEISRDPHKFDLFYHAMYRPYILRVHGNRAALMSHEAMMSKAANSELLLIKRNNHYIAGENLLYEGGGVRAWSLGVIDGDQQHVRDGVISALYYHKIRYLAERGYDRFRAGASRAFLNDGVLQYKKKWGLRITWPRAGGWWLRQGASMPGNGVFMQANPFIYRKERKLYGCVCAADSPSSDHEDSVIRAKYAIPGLEDLHIYRQQA